MSAVRSERGTSGETRVVEVAARQRGAASAGAVAASVLGALALALTACAGSSGAARSKGLKQLSAMADRPEAVVQMRRAGCAPGDCPVYSVSVLMDGTIIYEGLANVATIGQRRDKLTPERLREIIFALEEAKFLDAPEECCVCRGAERPRLVLIDYRPGSAQKSVIHDEACQSAPDTMNALADRIQRATEVQRWTSAAPAAPPERTAEARDPLDETAPASIAADDTPAPPAAEAPAGTTPAPTAIVPAPAPEVTAGGSLTTEPETTAAGSRPVVVTPTAGASAAPVVATQETAAPAAPVSETPQPAAPAGPASPPKLP